MNWRDGYELGAAIFALAGIAAVGASAASQLLDWITWRIDIARDPGVLKRTLPCGKRGGKITPALDEAPF